MSPLHRSSTPLSLHSNSQRVSPACRRLRLEQLESRLLLTTSSTLPDIRIEVTGTEIYIVASGTDLADTITIHNLLSDDVRITIDTPGMIPSQLQETYDIPTLEVVALTSGRQFTGFRILGGDGDDQIDASRLKYHGDTTLDGGNGDDTISGSQRNDKILGGAGDDRILLADHLDELSEAGGPGRGDSVTFVKDVVTPGLSKGITLTSDNIESVTGTNDHDVIDFSGNSNDVTISGGGGKDTLTGGDGNDTLVGGLHDDQIFGGPGNDLLSGEHGDDTLHGGDGNDTLEGGDGQDSLFGEAGRDTLRGGAQEDTLDGGTGNDLLEGGIENDLLRGGEGDDLLDGGNGDDTLYGELGVDTLFGRSGEDRLSGGAGADALDGGPGIDTADFVDSMGAALTVDLELGNSSEGDTLVVGSLENVDGSLLIDNTLIGDANDNRLVGGPKNDTLSGRDGKDILRGGKGDDHLRGEGGDDLIYGGADNDLIEGDGAFPISIAPFWLATSGNDTLFGGDGDDTIYTNDLVDVIPDRANSDRVVAGAGDDTIYGDAGTDDIAGQAGNDILFGRAGPDTLHGGAGSDSLTGGSGADLLVGGEDADTLTLDYLLASHTLADVAAISGSGPDTILVVGDTGALGLTDEVFANLLLDGSMAGFHSDFDASIDGLFFP